MPLLGSALSRLGAQHAPPQNLWTSLGAGATIKEPLLMASASYSRGAAVVMGRLDGTGAFTGPSVNEKAILAGVRTGRSARFALAAVGIGRSRSTYRSSENTATYYPPRAVFAFQVQAQPGLDFTPLGIAIVGACGPSYTAYFGAVLTLDFGWFQP